MARSEASFAALGWHVVLVTKSSGTRIVTNLARDGF